MKTFTRSPLRGLVMTCLALLFPLTASAYSFESGGVYYNITSSDDLTVAVTYETTSYNSYSGDVVVPSTVTNDGTTYTVTSVGGSAFSRSTDLTSVTLPENLTSIGNWAFYDCSSLTSVNLPDGVTALNTGIFYNCSSLASVTLPEGLTYIGTSVFYGCSSLTSITLPESLNTLDTDAFRGCTGLEAVYISDLEGWCNTSINVAMANPLYYAHSLYVDGELLTSLVVPEGLTSIGKYAFNYCTSITSITLPESVTSIGIYAFDGCTGLTSINIPEATRTIGQYAFRNCTSLADITVGGGLTSIGEYAFYGCSSMTNFTFPEGLTSIGGNAFNGCSSLTSVTLPESVTSIETYVFNGCTSLTDIVIPEGVTSIGDRAFYNCKSLTSIKLPGDLASIGTYAFGNCTKLCGVYSYCVTPPTQSNSFSSVSSSGTLHVLKGLADKYSDFVSGWTVVDDLTTFTMGGIRYNVISGDDLTVEVAHVDTSVSGEVTTSGTVTNDTPSYTVAVIADSAFLNCADMTSISIGKSVTSIGQNAFSGCTGLAYIYCYSTTPPTLSSTSFDTSTYTTVILCVPEGSAEAYKAADYWSNFTIIVEDNLEDGISSPVGLLAIADDLSGYYTLAADIDMSGIDFTPMGEFTGTLDGRGHVIKNLTYDNADTDNVGLFSTARGATVKNLGIQGARIVGNANVGGFIGRMYGGTITNCFLLDSYVEGSDHVGSILGYLDNNNGALSTMSDCASDSRIKTRSYQAGGMVGVMHGGTLQRCLFTGTVEGPDTHVSGLVSLLDGGTYMNEIRNNMLASAHAYGNSDPSSLVVYTSNRSVTLKGNYVLGSTLTDESGSTVGLDYGGASNVSGGKVTDATARSKSFYTSYLGWDFDDTWTFAGDTEGCMYPMLQVMPTPLATRIYDVPTDTVLYADLSETLNLNLGHGSWGQELSYEITGGADLATLSDGVLTPNSDAAGSGYVTVVASFPEAASAVLDPGSIEIKVLVGTTTGIGEVDSATDTSAEPAYYSLDGRRLSAPRKGVNIVRLPDGTVKKVLMK